MLSLNRSALLVFFASLTTASVMAEDDLRLIEVRPGERYWATYEERNELFHRSHAEGKCGGFMDITDYPISKTALRPATLDLYGREPKEQARVEPMLAKVDEGNLLAVVTRLSAFKDRKYNTKSGVEAATWIRDQYREIAKGRSDIQAELFAHKGFIQPSVIAEIKGNGPQKNEIVVIGGHLDSIASGAAPGADDNASGTATTLEAFRLIVESGYRPNRTLQFMGYAGEEVGLLGSGDLATWYRNNGRTVVGALQFDMTMFSTSNPRITFITDYTNPDLTKFTQRLSDEYVKAKWIEDRCGYACSDHASWTRAGFPSAFPFETAFDEYNPDIHSSRDTTANLDPGHGVRYLKLGIAFAVELAETTGQAWRIQ